MLDDTSGWSFRLRRGALNLLCTYLRPGLGVSGANARRLANLGALLSTLTDPWAIFADWNNPPEVMQAWAEHMGGEVVTAGDLDYTCRLGQQQALDYVIASPWPRLVIAGLERADPTSWTTHVGLELRLRATPQVICGPLLAPPAPAKAGGP